MNVTITTLGLDSLIDVLPNHSITHFLYVNSNVMLAFSKIVWNTNIISRMCELQKVSSHQDHIWHRTKLQHTYSAGNKSTLLFICYQPQSLMFFKSLIINTIVQLDRLLPSSLFIHMGILFGILQNLSLNTQELCTLYSEINNSKWNVKLGKISSRLFYSDVGLA